MTRHHRGRRPLLRAAVCGLVAFAGVGLGPVSADARPYTPSGTSVTGGGDAGAAVTLAPGVYVDTMAEGAATATDTGSVRYFAIAVRAGERPYVAVTLANPATSPSDGQLGLDVALIAQGESSSCATETATDYATDDSLDAVTAVLAPGPIGTDESCPAGNLVIRVERTGDAVLTDPLRVEIAYRLEPMVTITTGLPGPITADQPELRSTLTGTPATLASGNSFDTAPLVGTGIYRDTLTPGDTRIVRVRLDWGQRFAYAFSAAPQSGIGSDESVQVTSVVRNPVRQVASQAMGGSSNAYSVGSSEAALTGATFAPVRYLNRLSDDSDVTDYATAGDYYLVLTAGRPRSEDDGLTYPYSLQLTVSGAVDAPPVYAGDATSSPPTDGASPDSGSDTGVVIAIVAGTVVLLLVVLVVFLLVRRRALQVRTHM